jgi:hypothetical protein
MPYNRDLETLKPLIDKALDNKEILEAASDAGLSVEDLKVEIEKKAPRIWEVAGPAVEEFNKLEAEYDSLLAEVEKQLPKIPRWTRWADWLRKAAQAALTLLTVGFLFYAYRTGFKSALQLFRYPLAYLTLIVLILAGLAGNYLSSSLQARLVKWRKSTMAKLGLGKRAEMLASAKGELETRIIQQGILEECREFIENQLEPSYSTELTITKAPGLAEVLGSSYAINTVEREKLHYMLNNMPSGSIGIAGPRGAGKTTLLWTYCSGAVNELQGRSVLGVMTSAPVEYEPRDFILYLFQSVCHAVLKNFNQDVNTPPWRNEGYGMTPLSRSARKDLRLIAMGALYLGAALIVASFLLVRLTPKPASAEAAAAPSSASAAATPSPTPAANAANATSVSRYFQAFGFNPGTVITWGFIVTVIGLALFYFGGRERLNDGFAVRPAGAKAQENELPLYVEKAWEWVRTIRFQQSYTSGWSGALKLPVGLEGNMNRAISMSENQKSLPELVGGLREFLEAVASDFQVIIGIDELDKLESDEMAQRFINEIKSVFGLRRCFYLVSVSESAMSNFERRGLPFRDAFDSSFDNILNVDYLNLAAAKRLIARRIIGMSNPFRCLCYCISGGLARDLIRTCRNLVELVQEKPDTPVARDLASVCNSLIRQDVKSKVRAIATSARKLEIEPECSAFLASLHELERVAEAKEPLDGAIDGLCVNMTRHLSDDKEEAKKLAESRRQLALLGQELTGYLYYSDTLLHFFGDGLKEESLRKAEESGALNLLARARQSLGGNSSIAKPIIQRFREEYEIVSVNGWSPTSQQAAAPVIASPARVAGTLIFTDTPGLQKSIEGLKAMLETLGPSETKDNGR